MMIIRLPTTLCVRRDPKFKVWGSKFRKPRTSDLEFALVPRFALFSPWEPRYEQTD